ncbi:MAG: KH domain-containing protein [Candidatus Moduliflexus flocculans]|nr:KH domain-containing protein [Candidatus Moduliflexus flocculans]
MLSRILKKKIIVGEKGSLIKKIGTEARQELEKITETKIFLELFC